MNLFNHTFEIELCCEVCGKKTIEFLDLESTFSDSHKAFHHEYGAKKDQMGRYWWTCDCGGSMYVSKVNEKSE